MTRPVFVSFIGFYGQDLMINVTKVLALSTSGEVMECKVIGKEWKGLCTYIDLGNRGSDEGDGYQVRGEMSLVAKMIEWGVQV